MFNFRTLFLGALIVFSAHSYANTSRQLEFSQTDLSFSDSELPVDQYYTIGSVELNYLGSGENLTRNKEKDVLGVVLGTVDKIIATGEKVWSIIEEGRPVSNLNNIAPLNVFPALDGKTVGFHEMESWSYPKVFKYQVVFKNKLGMEVVKFSFRTSYQYGGTFKEKGKYLAGVSMQASNVEVAWGYDLNSSTKLVAVSNHGTLKNPVAGATLELNYTVKTVVKSISTGVSFHIDGSGKFISL